MDTRMDQATQEGAIFGYSRPKEMRLLTKNINAPHHLQLAYQLLSKSREIDALPNVEMTNARERRKET